MIVVNLSFRVGLDLIRNTDKLLKLRKYLKYSANLKVNADSPIATSQLNKGSSEMIKLYSA